MDDDKFFEIRETLVSLLSSFRETCEQLNIDFKEEIEEILDSID